MKKSKAITLILVTSSIFLGCEDKVRNQYASWDDCVKDYNDPTKCVEEKQETQYGMRRYYYGPWFRMSYAGDPRYNPSRTSNRAMGISRSGFGSRGGAHASS